MALVVCGSVKGSPGATTSAMALGAAARAHAGVLLAECDPAGGDMALRMGCATDPGLVGLAAATRRGAVDGLAVHAHTRRCASGVQVLVGPAGAGQATAALEALAEADHHPVVMAARQPGRLVVGDVGRLDTDSPSWPVAEAADQVLVVVRPTLEDLAHAAPRVGAIAMRTTQLGLLVVGTGAYSTREIAATLGVEVIGVLPRDRVGASGIGRAVEGHWGAARARLPREAQRVMAGWAPRLVSTEPRRHRRSRRARMRALVEQEATR